MRLLEWLRSFFHGKANAPLEKPAALIPDPGPHVYALQDNAGKLWAAPHPHDQTRFGHVSKWLGEFKPEELDALKWLLDNGETRGDEIPFQPGWRETFTKAMQTKPRLVVHSSPAGRGDVYTTLQINENYREELRDFLYGVAR